MGENQRAGRLSAPARQVALIGLGAIGHAVLESAKSLNGVVITHAVVRSTKRDELQNRVGSSVKLVSDIEELPDVIDLVVECAGHEAVRSLVPRVLRRGRDVAVVSVGAFADRSCFDLLQSSAVAGGARLSVLPGAIGGIDALAAAGPALETVRYCGRKPPSGWFGSPADETHNLRSITEPTEVFNGTAREAALAFPKNANVVATVALAGIGFDRTHVSLMADPTVQGNTHEISATGGGYALDYKTCGAALPDNPKTSALTAQSVLRSLRALTPGIQL